MTDDKIDWLKSDYGIDAVSLSPAPGGFSAKAAYRVKCANGPDYFLKVYDKTLPTTRFFIDRIDAYMPVLEWLSTSAALHGRVLTPVKTKRGTYKIETENEVSVLFLFEQGTVPGIQGMTQAQTAELAETLALLHSTGATVPFETPGLEEDVSLPFCVQLIQFLDHMDSEDETLYAITAPHARMLRAAAHETQRLRDAYRTAYSPLVLCHGDAHGNNVIQGDRLVLADWEDLRLAPAEADLFIHAWHPHGGALLEAYAAARPGYRIHQELLHFYVLRRRLEDVWVDIQRLTEEAPPEAERANLLDYIHQGIKEVQSLMK